MTEKESKEIIDRLRQEALDELEEKRKHAFPFPPQRIDDDLKQATQGGGPVEP